MLFLREKNTLHIYKRHKSDLIIRINLLLCKEVAFKKITNMVF